MHDCEQCKNAVEEDMGLPTVIAYCVMYHKCFNGVSSGMSGKRIWLTVIKIARSRIQI